MTLEHDEHGPACAPAEFHLRGVLATRLKCWHRLTEDEVANLLEFVRELGGQAAEQTPYGWVRMNGVFNSGVFHLGATCPPGWVGAAEAVTLLVAPIQQVAEPAKQCATPEQCKNTFCAPPCPGCKTAPTQQAAEPVEWPHKWGCRANAFGECNMGCTVQQPTQQPVLVRDLAEILGATVPEVCDALAECGGPRRSTNMAVSGVEALAVAAKLKQAAEPVAWTLTETLAKRKTTTRGFLWFSDPQNCLWTALYTRAAHQQQLTEAQRTRLRDAFAQALGDAYLCGRAWEAWSYGTMTADDFQPAGECEEVLNSLIEAVHAAGAQS